MNQNQLQPLPLLSSFLGSSPEESLLQNQNENPNACHAQVEDVTVALHIGLPDHSSGSNSTNNHGFVNATTQVPNNYWIPPQEQILIGFSHFSGPVCHKTFNRYNNLQGNTRENEVAEILLSLPTLMWEYECGNGILPPSSWGCRRKRSAIAVDPKTLQEATSSPATPLSFSPSESDENPTTLVRRRRRNVSLKRKREHYLKITQDLTKDNDLLRGEIKNVNGYCDKKEYNLKLKARKQELSHGPSQGGLVHKQAQEQFQFSGMAHHPPLILNQTAGPAEIRSGEGVVGLAHATTSLGVASLSSSNNVGPVGIPDLNLPLDEPMTMEFCEALDMNVANKNLSRSMASCSSPPE